MSICLSVFWKQRGKFPSFLLWITKDAVGKYSNRNQGYVCCRANFLGMFSVQCTARRLSFPSSYISSGTLARDFKLSQFSYLFVSVRIPPSFECHFSFPPSFVPSFLLLLSSRLASHEDELAGMPSGVSVRCYLLGPDMMFLVKSGLVIRRVPHPSQGGVVPVSFVLFRLPAAGLA